MTPNTRTRSYRGFTACLTPWGKGLWSVSLYDEEHCYDHGQVVQQLPYREAWVDAKLTADTIRETWTDADRVTGDSLRAA